MSNEKAIIAKIARYITECHVFCEGIKVTKAGFEKKRKRANNTLQGILQSSPAIKMIQSDDFESYIQIAISILSDTFSSEQLEKWREHKLQEIKQKEETEKNMRELLEKEQKTGADTRSSNSNSFTANPVDGPDSKAQGDFAIESNISADNSRNSDSASPTQPNPQPNPTPSNTSSSLSIETRDEHSTQTDSTAIDKTIGPDENSASRNRSELLQDANNNNSSKPLQNSSKPSESTIAIVSDHSNRSPTDPPHDLSGNSDTNIEMTADDEMIKAANEVPPSIRRWLDMSIQKELRPLKDEVKELRPLKDQVKSLEDEVEKLREKYDALAMITINVNGLFVARDCLEIMNKCIVDLQLEDDDVKNILNIESHEKIRSALGEVETRHRLAHPTYIHGEYLDALINNLFELGDSDEQRVLDLEKLMEMMTKSIMEQCKKSWDEMHRIRPVIESCMKFVAEVWRPTTTDVKNRVAGQVNDPIIEKMKEHIRRL